MAFSVTRVTSTEQALSIAAGGLDVGGGAAAPASGADLLNMLRNWAQNQKSLNGKTTKVQIAENRAQVIVEEIVNTAVATPQNPQPKPTPQVRQTVYASILLDVVGSASADTGAVVANNDNCTLYGLKGGMTGPVGWDGAPITWTGTMYLCGPYRATGGSTLWSFARSVGGITWTEFTEPEEGGMPYGDPVKISGNGDTLIMAFYSRGIFRSTDGGATWILVKNFAGAHSNWLSLCVHGGVWVLGRGDTSNAVWYSLDDGATWGYTLITASSNYGDVADIIYDGTRFAAIIEKSIGATSFCYTTGTDPSAWTSVTIGATDVGRINMAGGYYMLTSANQTVHDLYYAPVSDPSEFFEVGFSLDEARKFYGSGTLLYGEQGNAGVHQFIRIDATNPASPGIAFINWTTVPGFAPIVITPEDIANANSGGGAVSFFSAAGLDPAYLTAASAAVGLNYPPSQPAAYVDGTFTRAPIFYALDGQLSHLIASFNGQFFNFVTGQWQDAQTAECRQPANYSGKDGFTALLASIADGPPLAQAFFISGYNSAGTLLGVELVAACTTAPAFLQLASGSQYMNFTTWKLQADPTEQTWLEPTDLQAGWVTPTATWHLFIADMPITAAGLEPYTPPTSVVVPGTGDGDYIGTATGVAPVPYGPFTLLVAGGFNEIVSPPVRKQVSAGGFNAVTAPPLPVRVGGGFMESGSSIVFYATATAVTQHMGLPFTTQQG